MKYLLLSLIAVLAPTISVNSFAIGYPENNVDLGSQGDFLWKEGTRFGRTANLTNIGPYLINLPEGPGTSGVALPNGATHRDSIWDMSDLANPELIHEFDQAGQPIHAHATIIRFTNEGPRLVARNSGDLGYNPDGQTSLDQIIFGSANWPNDIFAYSQMSSPFATRAYWSYDLNRAGAFAIHDPSDIMELPSIGGFSYSSGVIHDLFGYDIGVWLGEPYVYWNHFEAADVTGFASFFGHYMVIASDQLSTGLAVYDVSGVREGRVPRLVSVYQPQLTEPNGNQIGIGGYWVEPYGTTKMVYAARRNDAIGRSYSALYVVDFEDAFNPRLTCEIYFDRDPNDPSDGDDSTDTMYVNFQDEYVYVDHFKVNLNACEEAYGQGQTIAGEVFHDVVYRFNDIPNHCDGSQYFRPLGQLGVFGGYDWWITPDVNEQGMCGFVTSDEPDTRPPFISGHRPFAGQANYPIDGFIQVHIPETLRTETVEGAITVTNMSTGQTVDYRQIQSHTGMVSLFPFSYLDPNSQYLVEVSGIQDYMGNMMADYSFQFSTGDSDLLQGEQAFPRLNYISPAAPARVVEQDNDTIPTYSGASYFPNQSSPIACQSGVETGDVWVVNPDNDSVSIIETRLDLTTMEKTHALETEILLSYEAPTSVTRTSDIYVVTYRDDDKVVFFNGGGQPQYSVDTGHGSQPVSSVSDGTFLYVALYASGEIIKIDINQREVVQRLEVGPKPKAMALYADRLLVTRYISPADHGEVYDLDVGGEMALTRVIEINKIVVGDDIDHGNGVPNYLSGIAISEDGERAYVSASKANTDRGLGDDSPNHQTLDGDNTIRPMLAILDLVANRDANVDPTTRSNTLDLDNGADPSAVSFLANPAVRVTALQGNDILIFSNSDRNSIAQFDTEGAPQGMCATRRTLYVKNFTGRSVTAIDVADYLHSGSINQRAEHISTVQNEVLSPEELLGLEIFYHSDIPKMGEEGYMTCASCHAEGSHDGRVWDITQLGEGLRNTISLNGASGTRFGALHWSANFDEVQDFELQMESLNEGEGLVEGQTFTGQSPLELVTTGLSEDLDALSAYVSSLGKQSVRRSPYRSYSGELSSAAQRGEQVFVVSGCADCHQGTSYRDGLRHDVGTITASSGQRIGQELTAIRTPTLIELWDSAPYFHDGSAATLEDVLSRGEHNVELSQQDRQDLVQYLLSIDRELYIDDE